jgi:hypothetical protein
MQRLLGVRKSLNEWLKIVIFEVNFYLLKKLSYNSFNSICDYFNEPKQKDSYCIYTPGIACNFFVVNFIYNYQMGID